MTRTSTASSAVSSTIALPQTLMISESHQSIQQKKLCIKYYCLHRRHAGDTVTAVTRRTTSRMWSLCIDSRLDSRIAADSVHEFSRSELGDVNVLVVHFREHLGCRPDVLLPSEERSCPLQGNGLNSLHCRPGQVLEADLPLTDEELSVQELGVVHKRSEMEEGRVGILGRLNALSNVVQTYVWSPGAKVCLGARELSSRAHGRGENSPNVASLWAQSLEAGEGQLHSDRIQLARLVQFFQAHS
mmetsp:Transcript_12913/g.51558  ORF Transcript_12913/g.51558 Transcript_12913/m.51558 type:complete len:244 (+) Transcript_12913:1327-2058(+)